MQGLKDAGASASLSLPFPSTRTCVTLFCALSAGGIAIALTDYPMLLQIGSFTRECTMLDCWWKTWSGPWHSTRESSAWS